MSATNGCSPRAIARAPIRSARADAAGPRRRRPPRLDRRPPRRASPRRSAATRSIASTIFTYPVQRQRLPASARAISSRDGAASRAEQPLGLHDDPRRAEAALARAGGDERVRPGGADVGRQPLERSRPRGPRTAPRRRAHETTGRPSTSTVQAPHDPSGAQPSFIERSPKRSRSSSRRLVPGSASIETCRPFRMKSIVRPRSCRRGPTGPSDVPRRCQNLGGAAPCRGVPSGPKSRSGPTRRIRRAIWAAHVAPEERRMTAAPERPARRPHGLRADRPAVPRDADGPADLRPAHRPADDPGRGTGGARGRRAGRARPAQPLPGPLAQRRRPPRIRRRPGARRPAVRRSPASRRRSSSPSATASR